MHVKDVYIITEYIRWKYLAMFSIMVGPDDHRSNTNMIDKFWLIFPGLKLDPVQ